LSVTLNEIYVETKSLQILAVSAANFG